MNNKNSEAQIEILKELYSALNKNNVSKFLSFLDPQIVRVEFEGSPSGGTYRGIVELKEHFSKGRNTWTEGSCEPEKFLFEGNKVIVSVHVKVKLKSNLEWVEGDVGDVFTFKDNKIIEMRSFLTKDHAIEWAKNMNKTPRKLIASSVEPRTTSIYPEPFATMMKGRSKRALGNFFGIQKFGVNLTTIAPGAQSSLMHRHSNSEEFIYVLKGEITVVTEGGETVLRPGECIGFVPSGSAHMLKNKGKLEAEYIEIGDREKGDEADYPQDDIKATQDENGKWVFHHKNGSPY